VGIGTVAGDETGKRPATLKSEFKLPGTLVFALCITHTFAPAAVL
jgi:hypothetical protein